MIRNRLIFGVNQDKIHEQLHSEGRGQTFTHARAICRATEAAQAQLMIMSSQEHEKVYIKQEMDVLARHWQKCYK